MQGIEILKDSIINTRRRSTRAKIVYLRNYTDLYDCLQYENSDIAITCNIIAADFVNPCRHGTPLVNAFESLIVCNYREEPRGGCPENYWCHTGANYLTTACCPVSDNGLLL